MAITVLMPRMGYDMKEARVVHWLKAEGDQVNIGDEIAEIETDKAIIPMPSVGSGTVLKIIAHEGDTVPVGQVIAVLGNPGEDISTSLEQETQIASSPSQSKSPIEKINPYQPATPTPVTTPTASPLARKLAVEKGVDLSLVTGTGPGGRITESDINNYEPSPRTINPETVPLSRMRHAIAKLTTRSKDEIPHFYMSVEVSMDAATALRSRGKTSLLYTKDAAPE